MTLLLSLLLSCNGPIEPIYAPLPVIPGAPVAGAAEGFLELPIGVPLGCYTARCKCLGSFSYQDRRQGPYNVGFDESTGIHTRPVIKVIWLENGDDHLVLIKTDLCMSSDKLVMEVTRRLEAETGLDLQGKVVLSVSHSHSSYGAYNDAWHWFLGVDRYNEEIFRRMTLQLSEVAVEAWQARQPAKIGSGWARDWDPEGKVYSDRRGANNQLAVWDDREPGYGKDPNLHMLRVDALDGTPIAMAFTFGMHGIIMDADNPMISTDSSGGVETVVQDQFERPVVVMHLQGAGGDASPRGSDREYARTETIGEYAQAAILDLWDRTPTSDAPIRMETASRHIWQHHSQIRVTRDGEVDWVYAPLDPEKRAPDNVVYDENGDIISPIDEFNAPYGAAFCGSDTPLFPVGDIGAEVFPYKTCTDTELLSRVVVAAMKFEESDLVLPFTETLKAGTTVTRFGPIPTLTAEGEILDLEVLGGFFPGEPTAMYAEQWRRRVKDELGFEQAWLVGYAQDHEGYLLIPEDWLMGGYEPNINLWGPLQGEHIMEGMLTCADEILSTDVHDDPDPIGYYAPTPYADHALPLLLPDPSPKVAERITTLPEYLWVPKGMTADLTWPEQVSRVQGVVQFAWIGGDPMVDQPHISLERQQGDDWVVVTTRAGRPVTEAGPDILVTHTPDPLYPQEAQQEHRYWVGWQAVGHVHDRAGLPLGTYRLHVRGEHWVGTEATWPWTAAPYELVSDPFEVVPATISLQAEEGGVWAWIDAPAEGWRLVDLEGNSRGKNPVRGATTVEITRADGAVEALEVDVSHVDSSRAWLPIALGDATAIAVTDTYGNTGALSL